MSSKEAQQIKGQEQGNLSNGSLFPQNIELFDKMIKHQSQVKFQHADSKVADPKVQNTYRVVSSSQVVKTTRIRIQNRVIDIIDTFSAVPKNPNVNIKEYKMPLKEEQNSPLNRFISDPSDQKSISGDTPEDSKGRDFRNVVKNIFRLFQTWTKKCFPNNKSLSSSLAYMLKSNRKFNNNLVIKISKHPQLRQAFIVFSGSEGVQMIQHSRIKDKASHVEAIRKYRDICKEKIALDDPKQKISIKQQHRQGQAAYNFAESILRVKAKKNMTPSKREQNYDNQES